MTDQPTTKPTLEVVKAYLSEQGAIAWDDDVISSALRAEAKAQARKCRVPAVTEDEPNPVWDDDLAEALCRRVAANLANRAIPLGVQPNVTEFGVSTTRVGGLDREVRRLEFPLRKRISG